MKAPISYLRSLAFKYLRGRAGSSTVHSSIANALPHGFVLGHFEHLANSMDSYRSRARRGIANSETSGWKSVRFHAMVVWEITYAIILSSPHNAIYSTPAIRHWVERFEKQVYVSAKDKEDYHSNMARWIVSIGASSQIPGRLTAFSNPSEIASSSSGGNERNAYIYWQEQLYNRAQKLTGMFFSKFPNWCRLAIILQQQRRHTAPQHVKISHIVKYSLVIRMLENVVRIINVSRGQIKPALKKKLDKLEKLLISILCPRNVSPHHQGPSSSHQQAGGSQETLSEPPLMSPQSSHLSKRKSTDSESEEEEKPNKLMKQEPTEYIFSILKHETPEDTSKDEDDFDSGLDLSLKLEDST